jgi:hypothetical protein
VGAYSKHHDILSDVSDFEGECNTATYHLSSYQARREVPNLDEQEVGSSSGAIGMRVTLDAPRSGSCCLSFINCVSLEAYWVAYHLI